MDVRRYGFLREFEINKIHRDLMRPIAERPLDHGGDRELLMPLLERAVTRTGRAKTLAHALAVP